jgi:hypothetical protein
MYGRLWRYLPGGRGVKTVLCTALVALAAYVLWYAVFPWLSSQGFIE